MASPSVSLSSAGCPSPVAVGSWSLQLLKVVSWVPPPTCTPLVRRDKRIATTAPAQPHSSVLSGGPGTATWAADPRKRATAAAAAAAADAGEASRGGEGVQKRRRRLASGVDYTEFRTRGAAARAAGREDAGTAAQVDYSEGKKTGEVRGESAAGAATSRNISSQEAAREDGMSDGRRDESEGAREEGMNDGNRDESEAAREISRDNAMKGVSLEPPSSSISFLREPLPYSERVSSGPHSLLDDAPSTSAILSSGRSSSRSSSSTTTINTSDCSSGSSDGGDAAHGFATAAATTAKFELEFSAETSAIALVYFVQGVLGLSRLAVTFFLKDECGLDPAEVAVLTGVSTLPWLIKPLYGFISDAIPLFGYRRRSYLVLCGLTGALSWLLMAMAVHDEISAVAMILLSSLSAAVSDVVVDSIVVTRARGEEQGVAGSLQSLCWGSSAFGSILSAYFSGSLVEQWGPRYVFGLTAVLPLITTAVGFFVPEERLEQQQQQQQQQSTSLSSQSVSAASMRTRHAPQTAKSSTEGPDEITGHLPGSSSQSLSRSLQQQFGQLWETFRLPAILLPTIFIFFWQATPHSETAMFFYTTNVLGFGPEFLGRVRLVTAIASLAGVLLFNSYLKAVPLRRLFLWTNVVGVALGSSQLLLVTGLNRALGISDQFFLLGDSVILTVLGQISFMPVLVLAAQICPAGIEATLFATLMSVSNGAGVFGGFIGAGLTSYLHVTSDDFTNLPLLLIICNCSSLLALPLLRLLPEGGEDDEEEKPKES